MTDHYLWQIPCYFACGTGGGMLIVLGTLPWQILGGALVLVAFGILGWMFR